MRRTLVVATIVLAVLAGGAAVAQTGQRFHDVPVDHPQADAIAWAADVGLTVGYGDGTFRPDQALRRDHAVIFMQRFYDNILESDETDGFTRGDMVTLLHQINRNTESTAYGLLMDDCIQVGHGVTYSSSNYVKAWIFAADQIRDQCQRWATALINNPDDYPLVIHSDELGEPLWVEVHGTRHGLLVDEHYTHTENMQAVQWVHDKVLERFPMLEGHLDHITYVFNDNWTCRVTFIPAQACAHLRGFQQYVISAVGGFSGPATHYHEIGHTLLYEAMHLRPELADHDYKSECAYVSHYGTGYATWTPTGGETVEWGCIDLDEYTAEAFTNIMVGGVDQTIYDICADTGYHEPDVCDLPPGPHRAGAAWIDRIIETITNT